MDALDREVDDVRSGHMEVSNLIGDMRNHFFLSSSCICEAYDGGYNVKEEDDQRHIYSWGGRFFGCYDGSIQVPQMT